MPPGIDFEHLGVVAILLYALDTVIRRRVIPDETHKEIVATHVKNLADSEARNAALALERNDLQKRVYDLLEVARSGINLAEQERKARQ